MQGQDVSGEYVSQYIFLILFDILDAPNSASLLGWISRIRRHPCVADSQAVLPMFIQAQVPPHFQNLGDGVSDTFQVSSSKCDYLSFTSSMKKAPFRAMAAGRGKVIMCRSKHS